MERERLSDGVVEGELRVEREMCSVLQSGHFITSPHSLPMVKYEIPFGGVA
jgi:hypothetical protein